MHVQETSLNNLIISEIIKTKQNGGKVCEGFIIFFFIFSNTILLDFFAVTQERYLTICCLTFVIYNKVLMD